MESFLGFPRFTENGVRFIKAYLFAADCLVGSLRLLVWVTRDHTVRPTAIIAKCVTETVFFLYLPRWKGYSVNKSPTFCFPQLPVTLLWLPSDKYAQIKDVERAM